MLTHLFKVLFQGPTCQSCGQRDATRADLCVYCYLDDGLTRMDHPGTPQ